MDASVYRCSRIKSESRSHISNFISQMLLPSSLVGLPIEGGWSLACDLRGVKPQRTISAIASWRWRDAMFEDPFGRSQEWIKFAEPSADSALRFYPSLEQGMAYPPSTKFADPSSDEVCGLRSAEAGASHTPSYSHSFYAAFGRCCRSPCSLNLSRRVNFWLVALRTKSPRPLAANVVDPTVR